jgi:iron complex transport system permease protein
MALTSWPGRSTPRRFGEGRSDDCGRFAAEGRRLATESVCREGGRRETIGAGGDSARRESASMTASRRLGLVLAGLAVLLLVTAVGALFVGSAQISPQAIVRVLTGRAEGESIERVVALGLRLPRIAAAVLAGGALAVAGVAFQALTRNPLAEPAILGVSSGAAFGVVVAQVFGLGLTVLAALGLAAFAFAGALVAAGAVYLIASARGALSVPTLLLAGVIVGIFFSSAITVLISLVDFNRLGGVIHWLLGNLAPIPPGALTLFAGLAAIGFWLVVGQARALNLLALGEETARQMGVQAERLKRRIFVGAALLTASVVAFAGPIGFVGLIVPHLLRGWLGHDNRLLVPTALLGGGIFLLLADTVARHIVAPAELSVGVVTSFCGAPFFIYLLRSRSRTIL